jgi:prolyl-tRNA synthetase
VPGRDFALEGANVKIADIRNAVEGDTYNGKRLLFKRGIEVGQVFKLGTKYSAKIGANFLDENGQSQPAIMGCYGIGINRIMASAIETGNDKDGIIWPISIAPFEVIITPVSEEDEIKQAAEDIYKKLNGLGVEVLLDDRDARGGVKFKDADLLGIPVRITIGKKTLAEGKVELKIRSESETKKIDLAVAADEVAKLVKDMKAKLDVEA